MTEQRSHARFPNEVQVFELFGAEKRTQRVLKHMFWRFPRWICFTTATERRLLPSSSLRRFSKVLELKNGLSGSWNICFDVFRIEFASFKENSYWAVFTAVVMAPSLFSADFFYMLLSSIYFRRCSVAFRIFVICASDQPTLINTA